MGERQALPPPGRRGEPLLDALPLRGGELTPVAGGEEVGFDRLGQLEELILGEQALLQAVRLLLGKPSEQVAPQQFVIVRILSHRIQPS